MREKGLVVSWWWAREGGRRRKRGRGHVLRGIKRGRTSMQTSERVDQTAQKTRKLIWEGEENMVVVLYQFATIGWLVIL